MFIAAALQHPVPPCNSNRRRLSTIFVSQHKNKFDRVVVYCTLASKNLVSEAYANDGNDGDPTPEYQGKCMQHDAKIYRAAYHKMLFLAPQYREMILSRPDYGWLLHDDVNKAYAYVNDLEAEANKPDAHENHKFRIDRLIEQWGVQTIEQLHEKLNKVYEHDW